MTKNANVLTQLWRYLKLRHKLILLAAVPLSVLSGTLDAFVLGSGYVFVTSLLKAEELSDLPDALGFILEFAEGFTTQEIGIVFVAILTVATLARVFVTYFLIAVANIVGSHLMTSVFSDVAKNDYTFFLDVGPSELVNALTHRVGSATNTVFATVTIMSNVVIALMIYLTLLSASPILGAGILLIAGSFFGAVFFLVKEIVARNADLIASLNGQIIRRIKGLHGSISEVKIYEVSGKVSNEFSGVAKRFFQLATQTTFIAASPRIIFEAIFIICAVIALALLADDQVSLGGHLSLGAFALLAIQRLMPVLQNIYKAFIDYRAHSVVCQSLIDFIDDTGLYRGAADGAAEQSPDDKITSIRAENVGFSYSGTTSKALSNVNFSLPRSGLVLIHGKSGAGKTTLLNLLLGLLKPNEGRFIVNGKTLDLSSMDWQRRVALTRQQATIIDGSIVDNILFFGELDEARLYETANMVGVSDFVGDKKLDWQQKIAEDGSSLSGGQRQRVGIARGLYRQSDILIADEPTSSLDQKRSVQVMRVLKELSLTKLVIVCSHDQAQLDLFDIKLEVTNSTLVG